MRPWLTCRVSQGKHFRSEFKMLDFERLVNSLKYDSSPDQLCALPKSFETGYWANPVVVNTFSRTNVIPLVWDELQSYLHKIIYDRMSLLLVCYVHQGRWPYQNAIIVLSLLHDVIVHHGCTNMLDPWLLWGTVQCIALHSRTCFPLSFDVLTNCWGGVGFPSAPYQPKVWAQQL